MTIAQRPAIHPYLGIVIATLAVSCAAIFISFATSPPLVTASYRMVLTVLLLAPLLPARRRSFAALSRHDWAILTVAGVLLAIHFATWTVSLFYTSVASSVLFVSVHPVLVAALAWMRYSERLKPIVIGGIALAILGSAIIAAEDIQIGGRALLGDALAVAGAVVFAFYLLIGRRVRQRLDPITYSAPIYAICAAVLVVCAAAGRQPFGPLTLRNLGLFLALALVCTLGGHLVYNWTLRYVAAAIVSVSFLGEPVFSSLMAWPLLGQPIQALTAIGGAIILAGLYLTTRSP